MKLLRTPRAPVLVVRAGIDACRIHGVGEEVRAAVYWLLTRLDALDDALLQLEQPAGASSYGLGIPP